RFSCRPASARARPALAVGIVSEQSQKRPHSGRLPERFVILIPAGEQDGARRQTFRFAFILVFLYFKVKVVRIFALPVMITAKSVSPGCVLLDDLAEVVEELAVDVHTSALDLGAGITDLVFVEQGCSFDSFESKDHVLECLIEVQKLLHETEL